MKQHKQIHAYVQSYKLFKNCYIFFAGIYFALGLFLKNFIVELNEKSWEDPVVPIRMQWSVFYLVVLILLMIFQIIMVVLNYRYLVKNNLTVHRPIKLWGILILQIAVFIGMLIIALC